MQKGVVGSCMLLAGAVISVLALADSAKKDRFQNYAELAAHEREGVDYRVEVADRGNAMTAIAIHGGRIEAGSDDAARLVAGSDWNLYSFIATKPEHNRELHLTSSHFDEPRALTLVHRSDRCVSMHGFALGDGRAVACVGGGNPVLAKAVYEALKTQAPAIMLEYPCARFGGDDAENILNRCVHQGVQIEMSPVLRDRLGTDPGLAAKFKAAVRAGMSSGR